MSVQICIFEDDKYAHFYPLTLTRPVFDLRCGMVSLREKLLRSYSGYSASLFCRKEAAGVLQEKEPRAEINSAGGETLLFLNGRLLGGSELSSLIPPEGESMRYRCGEDTAAVRCSRQEFEHLRLTPGRPIRSADWGSLSLPEQQADVTLADYCWDLLGWNGSQLNEDFRMENRRGIEGTVAEGVHLLNKEQIYIAPGCIVKPGAVIDAEEGPVYLDRNSVVFSNSVISGPVYIGENSLIKAGARLRGPVSAGPVCRLGGEISSVIVQGWTNKQHDGFLGNAFVGEWVNLGADTNNSDLKNNYRTVSAIINGRSIDTGRMLFGLLMGDHSKTAINTQLNTGTVAGVNCNIFGSGFPPAYIPSFSWGGRDSLAEYDFERALDTAALVMARRGVALTPVYRQMMADVFKETLPLRQQFGVV